MIPTRQALCLAPRMPPSMHMCAHTYPCYIFRMHTHTQKCTYINKHAFHFCSHIVTHVCRYVSIHKHAHAYMYTNSYTLDVYACIYIYILMHTQILSVTKKMHRCTQKTTIWIKYCNGRNTD